MSRTRTGSFPIGFRRAQNSGEPFPEWRHPPRHFNFTTDVVERWARERPEARALWCVHADSQETRLTFRELAEQARRVCAWFQAIGIRPGDRVLVVLPRVPAWWLTMLGLIRLGAVPIPGTILLTAKDLRYRVELSGATAVVADVEGAERYDGIAIPHRVVVGGKRAGWMEWEEALREDIPFQAPGPTRSDDPGMMFFTSGTTGLPKMVLHTQASYGLAHRVTGERWLDLRPGDVCWNLSDTGWAKAAWSSLFAPWQMGACVFAVDSRGKFLPLTVARTLAAYPITVWCAAPTILRLLVREDISTWRYPALRHCVSAGEALNPEVASAWEKATGLPIYEGYGQTESVILVGHFRSSGHPIRLGSMGRPTPGYDLELLDGNLEPVPTGREGELAIRISERRPLGLFREYWKSPEENEARFRNGWYLTGDMARRDAEGYYWFVGRADDVIKSSGYRIGPFEVESALLEHPVVLESAVVAKPDAMRGSLVKAFVVLRPGHSPDETLQHELQEHCKRVTAPYKYPREIEFVKELPKTISGKIRRVELRSQGGDRS